MKFLKKLLIFVIVVAVLIVGFKVITKPKNIKIGELYQSSTKEVVLLDVEVSDKVYVNGNERSDDFLSPFEPDTNDRFKRSTDENKRPIVVRFTVQNLSKADMVIVPDGITVDYNDGFEYWAESVYARTTDGVWEEFGLFADNGQLTLEKLTSGTVEVRSVIWVPTEVVEEVNGSLVLTFLGCRYEIR